MATSIDKDMSVSKLAGYEQGVSPKLEMIIRILKFFNESYGAELTLDQLITSDLGELEYSFPKSKNPEKSNLPESQELNIKLLDSYIQVVNSQTKLIEKFNNEISELKQKIETIKSII